MVIFITNNFITLSLFISSASHCPQWTSDQLTWQLQAQLVYTFSHTSHQPLDMIKSECPSSTCHTLPQMRTDRTDRMNVDFWNTLRSLWNLNQNTYVCIRGGTPTHFSLWQVTQYFWVFDSSLVKCQVTVSMPRQSISSHRFEWECLLSLGVWAVDFHQGSVSGLPCSQFAHEVCVTVLKFGFAEWKCHLEMCFFIWWVANERFLLAWVSHW